MTQPKGTIIIMVGHHLNKGYVSTVKYHIAGNLNFLVQIKFVRYKTSKKIQKHYTDTVNFYFLDIANESKFVKYRAL